MAGKSVESSIWRKKIGAGNLAKFSYTSSVNLSKKREAIKLAIWRKIDLAGKVLKSVTILESMFLNNISVFKAPLLHTLCSAHISN